MVTPGFKGSEEVEMVTLASPIGGVGTTLECPLKGAYCIGDAPGRRRKGRRKRRRRRRES